MKLNIINKLNPQYEINKAQIDSKLTPQTVKDVTKYHNHIYPYIPVDLCDNLILQNVALNSAIKVIAEDVILNEITYLNDEGETDVEDKVRDFWKNNQDELCNQAKDYYSYGFGASEIVFDKDGNPAKLFQIPAGTLYIKQEPKQDGEFSYYAIQQVSGKKDVKMRLSRFQYDESDKELPLCLWIGGGRRNEFYDYPTWISAFNHISASISLDMLDAKKISDGNLISGIITIVRPPKMPNEPDIDDTLETKMEEKGSGVFTLELTTLNPNIPLTVDYIQISESNYAYLSELATKCESKILSIFRVPKIRLMIDDVRESMNSNKSATIYEIYTIEIKNRQRPFENEINQFNLDYFDYKGIVDINTPIFSDKKEIEAKTTLDLFDKGLITLGQAINKINKLFPEYKIEEVDEANPIFTERYYGGYPLGTSKYGSDEEELIDIGDMIDYIQIN